MREFKGTSERKGQAGGGFSGLCVCVCVFWRGAKEDEQTV